MDGEKKTYYRTLHKFLKRQVKDKVVFVRVDDGWTKAIASKSKTKAGQKYNKLSRLVRKIKRAGGPNV